jgi:hypothetical protein
MERLAKTPFLKSGFFYAASTAQSFLNVIGKHFKEGKS